MVYTENKFSGQSSVCFIFQRLIYFICRRENPEFLIKVVEK